jgi:hypothetical protein
MGDSTRSGSKPRVRCSHAIFRSADHNRPMLQQAASGGAASLATVMGLLMLVLLVAVFSVRAGLKRVRGECPRCHSQLRKDASVCHNCGHVVAT